MHVVHDAAPEAHGADNRVIGVAVFMREDALGGPVLVDENVVWGDVRRFCKHASPPPPTSCFFGTTEAQLQDAAHDRFPQPVRQGLVQQRIGTAEDGRVGLKTAVREVAPGRLRLGVDFRQEMGLFPRAEEGGDVIRGRREGGDQERF